MLYCLGVQNVVFFRGSECCLVQGFRMLYCLVRYSECFIVQGFRMSNCSRGFRLCFIVQWFRMFHCSGVQNVFCSGV